MCTACSAMEALSPPRLHERCSRGAREGGGGAGARSDPLEAGDAQRAVPLRAAEARDAGWRAPLAAPGGWAPPLAASPLTGAFRRERAAVPTGACRLVRDALALHAAPAEDGAADARDGQRRGFGRERAAGARKHWLAPRQVTESAGSRLGCGAGARHGQNATAGGDRCADALRLQPHADGRAARAGAARPPSGWAGAEVKEAEAGFSVRWHAWQCLRLQRRL